MCGIVGAIAERDVVPILIEGLRRLEYRGYDSAGIAVLNGTGTLKRLRTVGKVQDARRTRSTRTRRTASSASRTRAGPRTACRSERNAHPHISRDGIAIVHNGIIENHEELRDELQARGLQVHLGDRHRSDRAPHALSPRRRRATCSRPCAPPWRSSKAPTRWR